MKRINPAKALFAFKPEAPVFVISVDKTGKPNGMAAGWNTKCAEEPPMLCVAIWKKANTHRLIKGSKEFVIAVPNKKLQAKLEFFGSTHGNEVDKFKETGIRTQPSKHLKSPLLTDATFNFECRLYRAIDCGDCTIFIGNVLAAYQNEDKKVLLQMGRKNGKRIFREFSPL